MVYILTQDRKQWRTFVDGLYPDPRQKGYEEDDGLIYQILSAKRNPF